MRHIAGQVIGSHAKIKTPQGKLQQDGEAARTLAINSGLTKVAVDLRPSQSTSGSVWFIRTLAHTSHHAHARLGDFIEVNRILPREIGGLHAPCAEVQHGTHSPKGVVHPEVGAQTVHPRLSMNSGRADGESSKRRGASRLNSTGSGDPHRTWTPKGDAPPAMRGLLLASRKQRAPPKKNAKESNVKAKDSRCALPIQMFLQRPIAPVDIHLGVSVLARREGHDLGLERDARDGGRIR
ncbi:hypothetical protein DFH09DRAFT_1285927 [Mycena vulgaris]|nr:hypothetical protein DFH09DRAFT_1285927 [Mycena vulgaris]